MITKNPTFIVSVNGCTGYNISSDVLCEKVHYEEQTGETRSACSLTWCDQSLSCLLIVCLTGFYRVKSDADH